MNQPAHPFSDSSVVISRHREISDAFGLSDGFVTRWLRRYLTAAPDPVTVSDGFQAFVTLGLFRTREDSLRLADSLATMRRYGRAHSDACAVADGYVASVTEPLVFTTGISMHIIPLGNGNLDSRFPRAYGDMLRIADGAAMSDGAVSTVWSASGLDKNLHIGHDPDGDIDSTYVYLPPVNHAPQWSGAPSSLSFTQGVGGAHDFSDYASDPDADVLAYSLAGTAYSGISIHPTTGLLTVTGAAAAAVRELTVRIADPAGLYADWSVTTTIQAVDASLVFATTFDGVSLLYVASYGYTYPNGPYTDGYSCADVVRLDGTDVNTGYTFTRTTPRLWGQTSAVRPNDPHITDVLIGTQRSFVRPFDQHDYRIISTTVPGGGTGKALFHRRQLPYVAPDLCAYTFYPNASIKMPTMLYQRFWMRVEPGFTAALNGFYVVGGAKNASGSLATSRCMMSLVNVSGQLRLRAYVDTEAAGTVDGVPIAAWAFFPGYPLEFPITTPEGQWFKIEFAFRIGADAGAFVWAAVNGSPQYKTGRTVVDGGSECPSEIYTFSFYTNSSDNPGESYTNWEMWYGWPGDASSHPALS